MAPASPPAESLEAVALLGEPHRRQLYDLVTSRTAPTSRNEAAAALGISRELAAHHLDRLAAAGLLATESRRLNGRRGPGAGRPAKLYRRAPGAIAVSLPARHYEVVAEVFADALVQVPEPSGVDDVVRVARARGRTAGAQLRRAAGPRPGRRRLLAALMELLRGAGYEPAEDARSGEIRLGNCPYDALAASHRDLTCGMNRAWADGLVEGAGGHGLTALPTPPEGRCCVAFRAAPRHIARRTVPD